MKRFLSKKQKSTVVEIDEKRIVKIVDTATFEILDTLKKKVSYNFLLQFESFRKKENKYFLIFRNCFDDTLRKDFFKDNIEKYIDFITPVLYNLNSLSYEKEKEYCLIHTDPSIRNYVLDNEKKKIKLIDLEHIEENNIIYQPLYLFIKLGMYNSILNPKERSRKRMKVFIKSFSTFYNINKDLYYSYIKKEGIDKAFDVLIHKIKEQYLFPEMRDSLLFLQSNESQIKNFLVTLTR